MNLSSNRNAWYEEELLARSSVRSQTVQQILFRGAWIAFTGLVFLFTAYFWVLPNFHIYALLLMLFSIALIAYGMLPYKKVRSLEARPYCIYGNSEQLFLVRGGKCLLKVPMSVIENISSVTRGGTQSMVILCKSTPEVPIEFRKQKLVIPHCTERTVHRLVRHIDGLSP